MIPAQDAREKRSMSLELFGQRLTVVSDNDEERVKDLVDFVNRKLEEVRDASRRVQTDQIALLALLNVAEELFRERQTSAALRRRVRERSVKLLGAIDSIARELEVPERMTGGEAGVALGANKGDP
jgi:cell division protein ZapA